MKPQNLRKTPGQVVKLYKSYPSMEVVKIILVFLSSGGVLLLMKRNDLSLEEDLARLCIFTACTALGWYLTIQKRSRHAQLRKPLLLESPPEKL